MRIVVLDSDKCKPKKCVKECRGSCPVVRSGTEMFEFETPVSQPIIHEHFCTGCGICTKTCRFRALTIVNTPERLDEELTHRFGRNGFTLFRLPVVKPGKVNGLVGQNGIGKSTALKILAGEVIPNFGVHDEDPSWERVHEYYKGTELQNHFQKMITSEIKCVRKPQYIDTISRHVKGTVEETITRFDERNILDDLREELALQEIWDRDIKVLSGGELQKLAVAVAIAREADIYLFDEPSSFLDIFERLRVGKTIRSLIDHNKTVVIVEHDLAVLDYLSDYVTTFYGSPSSYGIISLPYSEKEGINVFLDGFIPSENMRFRDYSIVLEKSSVREKIIVSDEILSYQDLSKVFQEGTFSLDVRKGTIHQNEIIGILGPNGIGKTTFIKMLAGLESPTAGVINQTTLDKPSDVDTNSIEKTLRVAYKPQYITLNSDQTVEEFLLQSGGGVVATSQFKSEIIKPFQLIELFEQPLKYLSGGELQKVAIVATLAKDADIYLFDEPSAFLSIEDRLTAAKIIRRIVKSRNSACFVVEHDIVFQDYASDRIIVFLGTPGVYGKAYSPSSVRTGMNRFLGNIKITFRRDPRSGRPRVNKLHSKLDRLQKNQGEYYYEK
ncbi:MAG: ribosome biogenesis/translation initiation ATPase RLI [Candidatus Heimdallarchaeota archaeon]|nr:MAG: ribosome biogenesis/translation initiation ATPase RLI [Candidatus Heimdallarchaeota archaeon]